MSEGVERPVAAPWVGWLGLAAVILGLGSIGLSTANAGLDNGLLSRPERLLTYSSGWLAIAAVLLASLAVIGLSLVVAMSLKHFSERSSTSLLIILVPIWLIALLPHWRPYPYDELREDGLVASLAFLGFVPAVLTVIAYASRRREPTLAWFTAVVAALMPPVAAGTMVVSARSGGLEPQLWALEFVQGMLIVWVAVVSLWLLGVMAWLRAGLARALVRPIPSPGRGAFGLLALVSVAAVVFTGGAYAKAVAPVVWAQLSGRTSVDTIKMDLVRRSYRLYRPSHTIDHPGLVVVLHGARGSGFQAESSTSFDGQADRLGWLAVYPDGVLDGWDTIPGPSIRTHEGADDVAFISALIDRLAAAHGVDPDRIYVTGFSRGASMSYRLGCELSGTVAAIAPVSGNMAMADGSVADFPCRLAAPVSVLAIHGTFDSTIPINGGEADVTYAPMADVIERWRTLDGCAAAPVVSVDGSSTTATWTCQGGATVTTRIVTGGGHAWPGAVAGLPYASTSTADDFDASRLIADFFSANRRAAG
jgi:polyhydroxybutyrate depolymerase